MELNFNTSPMTLDKPRVMGVLNVTPDSFSDGGRFKACDAALRQAQKMLDDGASIIDVGGESTRPGAKAVSEQQELDRVIPLIEALANVSDALISIDTSKAAVMREAVGAGASMINDVNALQTEGALAAAAALAVPVCMMHMQGEPRTMQSNPQYSDVLADITRFFVQRIAAAEASGVLREHIVLDPGFGFGKTLQHNLTLLQKLDQFHALGCPLLVGMSRKSMLGAVTGRPVDERLAGSVSAAVIAAIKGAQIIRVHDVAATVDAVKLVHAVSMGEHYND